MTKIYTWTKCKCGEMYQVAYTGDGVEIPHCQDAASINGKVALADNQLLADIGPEGIQAVLQWLGSGLAVIALGQPLD